MTAHFRIEFNLCFVRVLRSSMWWALLLAAIPQIVRLVVPSTGWSVGITAAGSSNVALYLTLAYAALFAVALPLACCYETRRRVVALAPAARAAHAAQLAQSGQPAQSASRSPQWPVHLSSVLIFIASFSTASMLFLLWAIAFNEVFSLLRTDAVETTTRRAFELAILNRELISIMFAVTTLICVIRAAWIHPHPSAVAQARHLQLPRIDPVWQIAGYCVLLASTLVFVGLDTFGWLGTPPPRYSLRLLPMGDLASQQVQVDMPVYFRGQYVGTIAHGRRRDSVEVSVDADRLRDVRLLEAIAIVRQPQFGLGGPFLEIIVSRLADNVRPATLSAGEDHLATIQMPCLPAIDDSGLTQTLASVQSFVEDAKGSLKSIDAATTQATVFMRQSGDAIETIRAIIEDYNSPNPKLPAAIALRNMEKTLRYSVDVIWPVINDHIEWFKLATKRFLDGPITLEWGKGPTTRPGK